MTEHEYRKKFASSGGIARAASLTKRERKEIAQNAAATRWANHRKQNGDDRAGNSHQRAKRAAKVNGSAGPEA